MDHLTRTLSRPRPTWLAGGIILGLVAASLVGPAANVARAHDDGETVRSISVSGTGIVKAAPDVADVTLGVTFQGKDAASASSKAAEAMSSVIDALLGLGIAETDIQTTSLDLSPIYDYDDNPPNITGWQASNMVSVVVRDTTAVGEVVDAATGAGATNVHSIGFRVEDPTEAQAVARSEAVADAEAKALQLAADARVNIVGVISISESGGQPPQPVFLRQAEFAAADGDFATPVLPGEVQLSVNVFIQYEIEG